MKQKDLDKLNAYFSKWVGAFVSFNRYLDDDNRLIIALERPQDSSDQVGVCFIDCHYLSGPTRWSNANLVCGFSDGPDGSIGFEVSDSKNGFLVKFGGPVVIGDGELIVPST